MIHDLWCNALGNIRETLFNYVLCSMVKHLSFITKDVFHSRRGKINSDSVQPIQHIKHAMVYLERCVNFCDHEQRSNMSCEQWHQNVASRKDFY